MLNEEVVKYRELSGDTNPNTPISRIGGYLDGYEKALEQEPSNDMVSRGVFEQVRRERDIAISQLKELGYEFGEKIEPCEDAISRQAVKELYYKDGYISFRKICELPPVTPQPKMGKWIKSQDSYGNNHFTCPFCEHDIATKADTLGDNYCSNCGAKLQEVEE